MSNLWHLFTDCLYYLNAEGGFKIKKMDVAVPPNYTLLKFTSLMANPYARNYLKALKRSTVCCPILGMPEILDCMNMLWSKGNLEENWTLNFKRDG